MLSKNLPKAFCWSKMGAEAGEKLETIIQRKEIERLANAGVFTWGIGTSLGNSLEELQREIDTPSVLFTLMKGKAKEIDSHPKTLLLWLNGVDKHGNKFDLPEFSLLTSRGHTPLSTRKKKHYALVCSSQSPITNKKHGEIDGNALVNFKSGKKVGASQVTSVVKSVNNENHKPSKYQIGFMANITKQGQIILSDCVSIQASEMNEILRAADENNVLAWKKAVGDLKLKAQRRLKSSLTKDSGKQIQIPFEYNNLLIN